MSNPPTSKPNQANNLRRRYRKERVFIFLSKSLIVLTIAFISGLFISIFDQGWRGFFHAEIELTIPLAASEIGAHGRATPSNYKRVIETVLLELFQAEKLSNRKKNAITKIIGFSGALKLRQKVLDNPDRVGQSISIWLPAGGTADAYLKGAISKDTLSDLGVDGRLIKRLLDLERSGKTRMTINWKFFTSADSSRPDTAGIGGAVMGSFYMLALTFLMSFPTAVLAAIYLEVFAPKNRWFDFIEININNLAAVPSIIFGLLGLAVLINIGGAPRSTPLVGAMVLSLMTLPTIIISARAALKAVPPSLLSGAMSLGATRMQGVFHHVLPAATPGMMTGTIIGMAQALGETAPLILIGMVAFINDIPSHPLEAATALPVQIYLWADNPIWGFAERSATAILVLLMFLAAMNMAAVGLRKKFEVRW